MYVFICGCVHKCASVHVHTCKSVSIFFFFNSNQPKISHIISYHARGDVLNNLPVFLNSLDEDMAVSMLSQGYVHL